MQIQWSVWFPFPPTEKDRGVFLAQMLIWNPISKNMSVRNGCMLVTILQSFPWNSKASLASHKQSTVFMISLFWSPRASMGTVQSGPSGSTTPSVCRTSSPWRGRMQKRERRNILSCLSYTRAVASRPQTHLYVQRLEREVTGFLLKEKETHTWSLYLKPLIDVKNLCRLSLRMILLSP